MLFVSSDAPVLPQQLHKAVDGIEWRLDLLPKFDLEAVAKTLRASPLPLMLTLRKRSQGGGFSSSEKDREKWIEQLLLLNPPFFDLEGDMRPAFLEKMLQKHPKTRFVLSFHDFEQVPQNLEEIYQSLSRYSPFCCKIAVMPQTTSDALKMLLFVRSHFGICGICMGEKGEFARILGKIFGNVIDYASSMGNGSTAPGQIPVEDLAEIYRYSDLNSQTAIYGLIGNPIAKSPGHIHHNRVFQQRNINAVYVKMIVNPEELPEFVPLAREIGIKGLSVTIPLKEKILPWIDDIDPKAQKIGAINTLVFQKNKIAGINTDGMGALDAIEKYGKVQAKKIVLLGAGGAARGIAFEAFWRKANIVVLNRTVSRAEKIAEKIRGHAGHLDEVPDDYDILINCSPHSLPIDPEKILSKALVMDIAICPRETEFLKEARKRGCRIVYGEEMFLNQANAQTQAWLQAAPASVMDL